jgi:hypothetical protein
MPGKLFILKYHIATGRGSIGKLAYLALIDNAYR